MQLRPLEIRKAIKISGTILSATQMRTPRREELAVICKATKISD